MSTLATGSLALVGGAGSWRLSDIEPLAAIQPFKEGFRTRMFEGFSTAGQTGVGHEVGMRIERLFVFRRFYARARTVRQDLVALLIIDQIGDHDLIKDLLMHGRIENRQQRLDSPVEIALHQVGRRNIDIRLGMRQSVAAAEAINPGMLEKPADDRFDPYIIRQPLDARPKAADPAHHEVDIYPRVARRIEGVDDLGIDEGIALCPDRAGLAGFYVGDF